MEPLLVMVLPFVAITAATGVVLYWRGQSYARFCDEASRDPHLELVTHSSVFREPVVALQGTRRGVSAIPTRTGGKHSVDLWRVRVAEVAIARRTTLGVYHENVLTRLGRIAGLQDIEIGEEGFDRRYRITGGEPDIVRGVMKSDLVRDALNELFNQQPVRSLVLDGDGVLELVTGRSGLSVNAAKALLRQAAALKDALDAVREVKPRPPPGQLAAAVGGASGAPVSIALRTDRS